MGRRSRIAQDPQIKEEVDRLIRDGATIDDIVDHLRALGRPIPRSTVGDYKQRAEAQFARYREAQEVAGVWARQIGEQPDSAMGELLAEMLKTLAFQTLGDMQGQTAEAGDLMLLSKTLDHLASAQKKDQEYRQKVRAAYLAELQQKAQAAAAEATQEAKDAGLTEEAAANIRRIVMGVVG